MAITEERRKDVWEDFLDAQRLYRHYHNQSVGYDRRQKVLRLALLLAITAGTVGALLPNVAERTWLIAAAVAVWVLTAIEFNGNFSKKAAIAFSISASCSELVEDYRALWRRLEADEIDDTHAEHELRRLADEMAKSTGRSRDVGLDETERRKNRSAREAYEQMKERYSVA